MFMVMRALARSPICTAVCLPQHNSLQRVSVAIMSEGHFTSSGHFIVLRGVKDGKIMVADPASYTRSEQLWDLSIILNEASRRAGAGGPFWIIG